MFAYQAFQVFNGFLGFRFSFRVTRRKLIDDIRAVNQLQFQICQPIVFHNHSHITMRAAMTTDDLHACQRPAPKE